MPQPDLNAVLHQASASVLETMFFADASEMGAPEQMPGEDAFACSLNCTGAEEGSFGVAVDREALQLLSESFYGEPGDVDGLQDQEVLRELTNMLAGSTLSRYSPSEICALSSPEPCVYSASDAVSAPARINLVVEGGILSLWCTLRRAA